jgi:hypothetical protein
VPDLSAEHRRILVEESGISEAEIDARGFRTLGPSDIAVLVAEDTLPAAMMKQPSLLAIPIHRPDGQHHGDILRLDVVGKGDKRGKYIWPTGLRNALDVSPSVLYFVNDPSVPLVVVEGVKKASAIVSRIDPAHPLCVVAINGAQGWRSAVDGGATVACPDWQDVALKGRQVILVPDSDYVVNRNVRKGWDDLALYLASKSDTPMGEEAKVSIAVVPMRGTRKQGADDFLLDHTLDDLLTFARSPEYVSHAGEMHFEFLTGKELYEQATDEVPWYVKGAIPKPSVTVIAGHTETYKTWHALRLVVDLLFGKNYLGHPDLTVDAPINVLYINKEMGRAMFGVRLRHLMHGEEYATINDFLDHLDERMLFLDDARADLNNQASVDALTEGLLLHEPEVGVLDSLSMSWGGDENSASEVGDFYRTLRELTQVTGCSWVIIHHLTKPQQGRGDNPIHQIRGSGQIVQQADSAFTLTHRDKDDLGTTITVHHSKSRAAQHLPTFLTRVANVDGAVEIKFAGLLKDVKAEEYGAKNADREALGEYVLHVLDEQSAMHKGGARVPLLLKLLGASWPPLKASERPSEATFRRTLKELTAEGRLELKEKSRGHGDLLRLVPDEEEDGEVG